MSIQESFSKYGMPIYFGLIVLVLVWQITALIVSDPEPRRVGIYMKTCEGGLGIVPGRSVDTCVFYDDEGEPYEPIRFHPANSVLLHCVRGGPVFVKCSDKGGFPVLPEYATVGLCPFTDMTLDCEEAAQTRR